MARPLEHADLVRHPNNRESGTPNTPRFDPRQRCTEDHQQSADERQCLRRSTTPQRDAHREKGSGVDGGNQILRVQRRMNMTLARTLQVTAAASLALLHATSTPAAIRQQDWGVSGSAPRPSKTVDLPTFRQAIQRVENMPFDDALLRRASKRGLDIVNVTWEDTGRYQGSSVGPNISDLTLQVREPVNGGVQTHLLPVLRHPNFSDKTADIKLDKIWLKIGNQTARGKTVTVPLKEVLSNLKAYLSDPYDLPGSGNFLADRDSHALVSAQHVFMPLPKTGKAEFTPVLYNYQSSQGAPAVLNLLVTRQGTSATVIENFNGDQSYQEWGQQLFFNNNGQRTTFTAERRSSVQARVESGRSTADDKASLAKGADMVMVIQVPLMVERRYPGPLGAAETEAAAADMAPTAGAIPASPPKSASSASRRSDVETAVIGHGEDSGPFHEIGGLNIRRDTKFPIRITVQFYKATSNGVVSDADLDEAKKQIDEVYRNGDYVGSLVLPDGNHTRPTDWKLGRTPYKP